MVATTEMDRGFGDQLNDIMSELHELVSRVQLLRVQNASWCEQTIAHCQELNRRIAEILKQTESSDLVPEENLAERFHQLRAQYTHSWEEHRVALNRSLKLVAHRLGLFAAELSKRDNMRTLNTLYQTLSAGYEQLTDEIIRLRQAGIVSTARARHLKPVNYARNIFHVSMGIGAALLYQFILTRTVALTILVSVLALFSSLELSRRFSKRWNNFLVDTVFGMISRPHERTKTNGSTWYCISLLLLVFLFPKPIVILAILTLALADPAASVVGKLLGKRKIIGAKTYLGSLTFLVVALGVSIPFALSAHGLPLGLLAALAVGLSATLAELFITNIDDNFTIPVITAAMAWLLF